MSLADYLAKNYLTAEPPEGKKSKKRKRKNKDEGLIIADDDISGWRKQEEEDDEDAPMIMGMTTSSKKSKKKSSTSKPTASWRTVGVAAPTTAQQLAADAERDAADAIIASTAAERHKNAEDEDEAPAIANADDPDAPKMESGAAAGLQTADQVAAAMKKKSDEEKRKAAEVAKEMGATGGGETIYRDASGRIINVAMKRAEARKKLEEEERKKREKEIAAKGDVQRLQSQQRRQELSEAKYMTVARYADDAQLNDEQKQTERWNDPAAGFLVKKKAGRSATGKPLYQGTFVPNRYGIRPGHRWDGVDRGNGFEKKWFEARNRKSNRANLEYAWQMDE